MVGSCCNFYYVRAITSVYIIQKVLKFIDFSLKTTHIGGCISLQIYTFTTVIVQIYTDIVTV